ncbi:YfiT family bacillithiol transferase [Paenibacillus tengchongensis]|uniref:YfiT family bacillithiol transferase n=1 Tax=Paenibacillus tengchongensis TaxID=2608684 RepID=UPI00124F2AA9|nr:putative metal-dependent hydrolase [Paenibacillus tengchongensis]
MNREAGVEERLRYPIGRFAGSGRLTGEERIQYIQIIRGLSGELRALIQPLTGEQMDTPYRDGGWSVREVVHHLADSGMYAYLRFKRGLTETAPEIPTYREDLWAQRSDYSEEPVESSLQLLESLHRRFVRLLDTLDGAEFERTLVSQGLGVMTLDTALERYVWHSRHHMAHIAGLMARNGWH